MPFNINTFRSQGLVNGGARPSLFDVEISYNGLEQLKFVARASQLPAMTIGDIQIPYFGRKIKLAGDRTFADWSITVMNDEDFKVRARFEEWSNRINTLVTNVNAAGASPLLYKSTAIVRQYSKAGKSGENIGKPIRSYKFIGIFPTQIDAINLDWETTNQIETFDVTFSYDWWEPYTEENTTGAVPYNISQPGPGFSTSRS
jgi:hypothetical protein